MHTCSDKYCLFNGSLRVETRLGPDLTRLEQKCSSQAIKAYISMLAEWSLKIERKKKI